jgi:carbonic anhydrase
MCAFCGQPFVEHPTGYSRRGFLKMAGATAAALAVSRGALFAAGEVPKPANVLTPDEALARLRAGNERYVSGVMKRHDFESERKSLAGGQNPFAGILSCAESRIAPEYAFDSGRGDLFVVRVAGNFLNEDGLASFEYAVKFLGTRLLVVLGHEKCGAVDAAIKVAKDKAVLPGHLPHLVESIRPAVEKAVSEPGNLLENAIRENVRLNVEKFAGDGTLIGDEIVAGRVQVVGGIYRLATGRIDWV